MDMCSSLVPSISRNVFFITPNAYTTTDLPLLCHLLYSNSSKEWRVVPVSLYGVMIHFIHGYPSSPKRYGVYSSMQGTPLFTSNYSFDVVFLYNPDSKGMRESFTLPSIPTSRSVNFLLQSTIASATILYYIRQSWSNNSQLWKYQVVLRWTYVSRR